MLVLDAGDSLVGDQDPAQRTQGKSSVAALNLMGYDALALGPQDLTLGLRVLRQRMAEAEFAVLSANAVESATGDLITAPYVLRDVDTHKVAIVGLSSGPDTGEIQVLDPLETAQAVITEVEARADVVILLSHAGPAVDQQIAENVPGIDLIVSGGDFGGKTPWRSDTTGTILLHADQGSPGHAGRRLGIARLALDQQGQLLDYSWQRLDLAPGVGEDPDMTAWVQGQFAP
jgi:2',3'-cyclic-nucleotide 2'-phosphodiesterase (5'-nucleotidase family)